MKREKCSNVNSLIAIFIMIVIAVVILVMIIVPTTRALMITIATEVF